MEQDQNNPQNKRFVVGYEEAPNGRELVFVYDKRVGRIVYTCNTRERKLAYPYIQQYYGTDNCVPPKKISREIYL